MDDCCAVCAEPLEWVAYGACAHRDVCSTCVVRLRNVCGDRRCCICKTECDSVFITKALGDYTRTVEFSTLPTDVREGRVGSYWYHEATQAFFDDSDHYKMIKAMCTFSCSVCDKEEQNDGTRRRNHFRSLEQLKGHLYHRHRLMMCRLCLEGRKVFICEQKLYTKAQLNQHISTGDSVVDGTESERGGFMGHPACEFCRTPFYGDNELYTHMSTEHYTCHICQRQNPGQFEYYKNYDDLEIHFRHDHFLCEDEACLAKKFVVFQSESEIKRHNALEHGGRMSRSKRSAVLQIPTSFRYRRAHEPGPRRGRGRTFQAESSADAQLSLAIQASLETSNTDTARLPDPRPSSSAAQHPPEDEDTSLIDPLIPPFEALATDDSETGPSRYLQAVSHNYNRGGRLEDSSFPPLAAPPNNHQQNGNAPPQNNTMAARLRKKNNVKVVNAAQAWPASNRGPAFPPITSAQARPMTNHNMSSPSGSNLGPAFPPISSAQARPVTNNNMSSSSGSSQTHMPGSAQARASNNNGLTWAAASNSRNPGNSGRMKNSLSASNIAESGSFDPVSDFPPVSVAQPQKPVGSSQTPKVEDVQTANKSLVERIHIALDHDQEKYAAFKDISQEYRQGSLDTWTYLDYATQFGLLHLVPDLARLCPDPMKQEELLQAYNGSMQSRDSEELFWGNGSIKLKEKKNNSKKNKGKKPVDTSSNSSKDSLADSVLETVRRLQSEIRHTDGEVEVLEKDGYRAAKGKSSVQPNEPLSVGGGSKASGDTGGGKKGKKTSKFHRVRLGDGSVGALLDMRNPANDTSHGSMDGASAGQDSGAGLPVRGVWRSGGGQKLFGASKN